MPIELINEKQSQNFWKPQVPEDNFKVNGRPIESTVDSSTPIGKNVSRPLGIPSKSTGSMAVNVSLHIKYNLYMLKRKHNQ